MNFKVDDQLLLSSGLADRVVINTGDVQDGINKLNTLLHDLPVWVDALEEEIFFEEKNHVYFRKDRMMVCIGQIRELLKLTLDKP